MASYTLDSLIADLKKNTYVPKTDEDLKTQAGNRYTALYDQKRLDAQQAADSTQLALDKQISTMGAVYAKQKDTSATNYAQTYSQANRQATSRGMQRSSFNGATLGNIAIAGNKAKQEIADNEATARIGISDQKTLLAQQLAAQIKQYSAGQAADTLAYIDELEDKEYDRTTASSDRSNSLASQIYQLTNQGKVQDEASKQWLAQFNEEVRQFNTLHPAKSGKGSTGEKKEEDPDPNDLGNQINLAYLREIGGNFVNHIGSLASNIGNTLWTGLQNHAKTAMETQKKKDALTEKRML